MDFENWAVIESDEEEDGENPETALIPAEKDVMQGAGLFSLPGDGMTEVVDDRKANKLSPAQLEAAALVAMGIGDEEVARCVGVCRQTVSRWKNQNIDFTEEVTRSRAEIWEGYRCRFRDMIPRAMEHMEYALEYGDVKTGLKAAMFVLRCLQLDPVKLEDR